MTDFTTELMQVLVTKGDVTELFRSHLEQAINNLLATELSAFLNYEKYSRSGFNSGNSRNGCYERQVKTEYGPITISIPRDRNGEFKQRTIEPYKRSTNTLEEVVIHLFRKGITMSEIADLIQKMYGHHYTPQTISNMTQQFAETVSAFNNRPLNAHYAAIYLDATVIPVRRDTVAKEAVHIAIGVRTDGTKEVLSYSISPHESAIVWGDILSDISQRGVENTLIVVADGFKGLVDKVSRYFPSAVHQQCCIHVARNLTKRVRATDRKEINDDFKTIYRADSLEEAEIARQQFIKKWQKIYPKPIKTIAENEYLLTFYRFPKQIGPSLYSTNLIESFNKKIKRYTKRKEQFPNEDALERFMVSIFDDYNQKFLNRSHKGFKIVQGILEDTLESL